MGYIYRYHPAFQFCYQAIEKGWFGELFEVYRAQDLLLQREVALKRVMAGQSRSEGEERSPDGLTLLLVDREAEGVSCQRTIIAKRPPMTSINRAENKN